MRLVTQTSSELLSLYSSKMLIQIFWNKVILISMNEDSSNFWKKSYSWLSVGRWSSILNDIHSGGWNLILAISNEGDWIGIIITFNATSNEYWVFLKLVLKILNEAGILHSHDFLCTRLMPMFIWQIKWKRFRRKKRLNVLFASLISELAPVEQNFRILKKRMNEVYRNMQCNFSNRSIKDTVIQAMSEKSHSTIT